MRGRLDLARCGVSPSVPPAACERMSPFPSWVAVTVPAASFHGGAGGRSQLGANVPRAWDIWRAGEGSAPCERDRPAPTTQPALGRPGRLRGRGRDGSNGSATQRLPTSAPRRRASSGSSDFRYPATRPSSSLRKMAGRSATLPGAPRPQRSRRISPPFCPKRSTPSLSNLGNAQSGRSPCPPPPCDCSPQRASTSETCPP